MSRCQTTIIAAVLPALALAAYGQSRPDFTGTWKANIVKSDFGAFPTPQSVVAKIDHKEPVLKVTTTAVGEYGERTTEFTFRTDGAETVNQVGPVGLKSKARWDGATLLVESKAAVDSGEIAVNDKWTLSPGGNVLTLVRHWLGTQGETTQTIVHEKQ